MAKGKHYKVKRKRRRQGKTDYRKRLELLKSREKRMVTRVKNNTIIVQIMQYNPEGDEVIVNTTSKELKKYGYEGNTSNVPSAYLTGLLAGKKSVEKGIKKAVLDIGLHTPVKQSRVFAVLKGAVEAGLEVPHGEEVLPTQERAEGKHIEEHRNVKLNVGKVKDKIMESESND